MLQYKIFIENGCNRSECISKAYEEHRPQWSCTGGICRKVKEPQLQILAKRAGSIMIKLQPSRVWEISEQCCQGVHSSVCTVVRSQQCPAEHRAISFPRWRSQGQSTMSLHTFFLQYGSTFSHSLSLSLCSPFLHNPLCARSLDYTATARATTATDQSAVLWTVVHCPGISEIPYGTLPHARPPQRCPANVHPHSLKHCGNYTYHLL
jgi:hypothetical protein